MLLKRVLRPASRGENTSDVKTALVSNSLMQTVDERDSSGTVAGTLTSCTSSFTSRAFEIQQKLRWKKNQNRGKNNATNDGLPEISEEYDIQTIVSGLTRNSEFLDRRDPPDFVSSGGDGNGDALHRTGQEWPDDESCGGNHVICIMDGDQVASKNTIQRHQENRDSRRHEENIKDPVLKAKGTRHQENRVSRRHKENTKDPVSEAKGTRHQENRASFRHKEKMKDPVSEAKGISLQKNRVSIRNKEKTKVSMSEPKGMRHEENHVSIRNQENTNVTMSETKRTRLEPPTKETITSKVEKINQKDPGTGYEMLLSVEPDGVRLKNGKVKIPIEPSGKKLESLICSLKMEKPRNSTNKKSRRRSPTVVMNDQDVELVFQEKELELPEQSKRKSMQRRSISINADKKTNDNGYPRKNAKEKRNDFEYKDTSHCSVNEKRRSRSLPRTLKRITSRYRKGEGVEFKGDPHPPKVNLSPTYIDGIVGVIENEIVSTLGSQCDGMESHTSDRIELEELTAKYLRETLSPSSCEAMFSPLCESMCRKSEPRVCVEFSKRKQGGRFQTTCYSDRKSIDPAEVDEDKLSLRYLKKTPDDASKIIFPEYDTKVAQASSENFSNKSSKCIVEEASRNSLPSPNEIDDFFIENEDFFASRYHKKETEIPEDASKIIFSEHDMNVAQSSPENFSNNSTKDKGKIRAIVKEASRNLLLSPNEKEDSFVENEDFFEKCRRTSSSHPELQKVNTKFERTKSNHYSAPVTPSPEIKLCQELSGHKSSTSIDDPDATVLSITPADRKDLIQRYLALREEHSISETSMSSDDRRRSKLSRYMNVSNFSTGQSVGLVSTDDGKGALQESSFRKSDKVERKSGYDDASIHYQHTDSELSHFYNSFTKENHGSNIATRGANFNEQMGRTPIIATRGANFNEQMGRAPTPLSSHSMSSTRRSVSDRCDFGVPEMPLETTENLFSLPNAYKHQTIEKESWSSPTLVSSFPYSQQEKLSYSYASDDTSTASSVSPKYMFDTQSPYAIPATSSYEDELRPHNQFMKMQIGLGTNNHNR